MNFDSKTPQRKLPIVLVLLVIVAAGLIAGGIYLRPRFESEPPRITLSPDSDAFGRGMLEISVADAGAGLKSLAVTLSADGKESSIAAEQFAQPVKEKKLSVELAKVAGIKEGPATLRIVARDGSLSNFFKGNEAVVQKRITLDFTPPSLELVADDRYVNFGGVGAIVYKTADKNPADALTSGVRVGQHFFPGFRGQIKGQPDSFFVLFAHPYNAAPDAKAVLVSTDKAGNTRQMPLVYELKNVKYRKSTIALSEAFMSNKVVPLAQEAAKTASPKADMAPQASIKEVFVAVNKRLRKENEDRIVAVTSKATPQMLWQGAFVQLSNSKVEANFADERTYTWNGEPVDTAYHLGYDLSVTKHYPIEAANSGTVAFAGDLGIYGNAVILDHGLGLFTLYGHMSQIDVKVGDAVKQRQPLGKSGETGLAAGDHLHYGVYLDGVAILPVEWWDPKWIADNITPKLEGRSGEEIAASQSSGQQPSRASRGGKKRRR
jgi:murein DD-endopeptidase MepM/ murein hydrolase activator NlpD